MNNAGPSLTYDGRLKKIILTVGARFEQQKIGFCQLRKRCEFGLGRLAIEAPKNVIRLHPCRLPAIIVRAEMRMANEIDAAPRLGSLAATGARSKLWTLLISGG
jgi:hypothetical protein